MNHIDRSHMNRNIENIDACAIVITTAEKFLSEYIDKIDNGECLGTFVFDGLCKTVSIATESMNLSVDSMRKIMEQNSISLVKKVAS